MTQETVRPDAVGRQQEIYLSRVRGRRASVPVAFAELERAARRRVSAHRFNYLAGSAGSEATMRENRAAFERVRILPRMLRDVGSREIAIELFGRRLPAPLLLAPIGVLEEAHREADLAVSRAAARLGVPFIFSNQASVPMERCAEAMGGSPRWFQLYYGRSDALVESLVRRAEACGCDAIVVTLDTTLLGFRARDLDAAYLPFLYGKGIAQYVSDPVFRREMAEAADAADKAAGAAGGRAAAGRSSLDGGVTLAALSLLISATRALRRTLCASGVAAPSFFHLLRSRAPLDAVSHFIASYSRPSLGPPEIEALRKLTRLPILLKGVLRPEDARAAVTRGVDGIIVSNHGGRQVDGAVAALDALPAVVEAVGGTVPVLFDSGVRGGADLFKALALGAKAVCLGRPYAYGLAVAGERGVADVVRNLLADLELTMALAGCREVGEIDRSLLVQG